MSNMLTFPAKDITGSGTERRRAFRQTLVVEAKLRPERIRGIASKGIVSNISTLGIGMNSDGPVPIGEYYRLRVEAGPMRWFSWIKVVSCRAKGTGVYDIGAEFITPKRSIESEYPEALAA